MSSRDCSTWALLAAGLVLVTSEASAQQTVADAGAAVPSDAVLLEPAALDTLKAMGSVLRSSRTLSFTARGFREELATTGQMVTFFRTVHIQLQRPDRLRLDLRGDTTNVSLFYDGKLVSLLDPVKKAFSSTAAPPTVDETIAFLSERFGTVFTLSAFLAAEAADVMRAGLQSAFVVGTARVNGVLCDQLAFTEKDVDWQLWVERGRRPLPRRLAVTFTSVPGAPREVLEFSDWALGAPIPAANFTFTPPAGALHAEMVPEPGETAR